MHWSFDQSIDQVYQSLTAAQIIARVANEGLRPPVPLAQQPLLQTPKARLENRHQRTLTPKSNRARMRRNQAGSLSSPS